MLISLPRPRLWVRRPEREGSEPALGHGLGTCQHLSAWLRFSTHARGPRSPFHPFVARLAPPSPGSHAIRQGLLGNEQDGQTLLVTHNDRGDFDVAGRHAERDWCVYKGTGESQRHQHCRAH